MSGQRKRFNSKREKEATSRPRTRQPDAAAEAEALAQQADSAALQRALTHPDRARPGDFLALQRTAGNRAVQRLIQTRLMVGPAGDAYEQEADRVAEQVMSMPAPPLQRQEGEQEEEIQKKPLAASITRLVQRQAPPEEEELQTKPTLQRASAEEGFEASREFEDRLQSQKGGGSPLPDDTRMFMESRFGTDFSDVHIHADSEAAQLNQEVQAQAFTHGRDIFIGEGKYSPGSSDGQRLLAHELTHVIQQTGAVAQPRTKPIQRQDEGEGGGEGELTQEFTLPDGTMEETEPGMQHGPCDCQTCMAPSEGRPDRGWTRSDGSHFDHGEPDGRAHASGPSKSDETKKTRPRYYTLSVGNIGVEFLNPGPVAIKPSGHHDLKGAHADANVSVGTIGYEFSNPGTLAVDPFGSEDFNSSHKDAKVKIAGTTATVDFIIKLYCPWGVNGGGKTDVPSGTDAVVTTAKHASGKKVYEQIAEDLTPVSADNWRPKRTYYWAKHLTERHEKYHSTMDEAWGKGAGTTVVKDYLNGKTVSSDKTADDVKTHLDAAMTKMKSANWDWYSGGGKPYIQRPGEKAAFLEGKDAYLELVKAVKAQGAKLEAEEKKGTK